MVEPPIEPMLARLARDLPTGDEWRYEPKWDGFRCLAFVGAEGSVDLRSRNDRPLARYFPEVVDVLAAHPGAVMACAMTAGICANCSRSRSAVSRVSSES